MVPNILLEIILNQARTGHRPVRAWFLEIDPVRDVCMCMSVCLPPRLLITSGVIWCDIDPYDWLNKLYGFYTAFTLSAITNVIPNCMDIPFMSARRRMFTL